MDIVKPQIFNIFLILFLLASCGRSDAEKLKAAMEEANLYLTSRECDKAIEILNKVGFQETNSKYLQIYSSAYACKGNFDEPTFFGTDLPGLSTVAGGMFGSLATFSLATMTGPTDSHYTNLQTAINYLWYAGGISSSGHTNRETIFTSTETNNIDVQNLYMIMVQLGRWLKYYGNADSTGVKGGGTAANTCLVTYTDSDAIESIDDGSSGSCTDLANSGHDDMEANASAAERTTRMCQGIVLLNNFINIITNISFSSGSNTASLSQVSTLLDTICSDLVGAVTGFSTTICSVRDQSKCENDEDNKSREVYLAWIFERNF
jgi:hypothetical protein